MKKTERGMHDTEHKTATGHGLLQRTEQLLTVLEADIVHMQESLSTLDQLRGLLVKHDLTGLEALLRQIRAKADAYATVESRRQSLRRQLATLLECPSEDLTLSRLETALPGPIRDAVRQRKLTLRDLAERLRREHRNTSLLLADCARFNGALFRAIFQQGKGHPVIYSPAGTARTPSQSHLMSVQF